MMPVKISPRGRQAIISTYAMGFGAEMGFLTPGYLIIVRYPLLFIACFLLFGPFLLLCSQGLNYICNKTIRAELPNYPYKYRQYSPEQKEWQSRSSKRDLTTPSYWLMIGVPACFAMTMLAGANWLMPMPLAVQILWGLVGMFGGGFIGVKAGAMAGGKRVQDYEAMLSQTQGEQA